MMAPAALFSTDMTFVSLYVFMYIISNVPPILFRVNKRVISLLKNTSK
jgi:hypothetical protein